MRAVVTILVILLVGFTIFFGVQVDLLDDRITDNTKALNGQVTTNIEVATDAHKRMDEMTKAGNDLLKSIESLQAEIIILKDRNNLLQEQIEKLNVEPQSFLEDKGLGKPQQFELPTKPQSNRNGEIAKLKQDIRKLQETINLFQYQRQHGGLQ